MLNKLYCAQILKINFLICTGLAVISVLPSNALAQRGQNNDYQTEPSNSASQNIPGLFDTELARPESFVFEFPTLSVDYGITARWTVGINALATLLGLSALTEKDFNSGNPAFLLKSRYGIFSEAGWTGTLTGYLLALNTYGADELERTLQRIRLLAGTINVSKKLNRSRFSISSLVIHQTSHRGSPGTFEQERERSVLLALTPSWDYKVTESLDTSLAATYCPYARNISSNITSRKDSLSGCGGRSTINIVWRVLLNWRASEAWLWTLGSFSNPTDSRKILPYLGFNYAWSPFADNVQNESSEEDFQ